MQIFIKNVERLSKNQLSEQDINEIIDTKILKYIEEKNANKPKSFFERMKG